MTRARAAAAMSLLAGLALAAPAARAQSAPHRYAVVVGANKASPGRRDLRYAHNDAQQTADTLIRVAGYPYDNVTVLLQADNLFDAEGRRHASFTKDFVPLAGRNLKLSLKGSF